MTRQLAGTLVRALVFGLAGCAAFGVAAAEGGQGGATELRNWFDDPFFAVSSSVAGCPLPRGPYMSKEEMDHDSHARVERGTRCYQAGECRKPNSYMYDPEIAEHVRAALGRSTALRGTTLWVTVQRRWVFIQGCVDDAAKKQRLERLARSVPDVERVFVDVVSKRGKPPPYPVMTQ